MSPGCGMDVLQRLWADLSNRGIIGGWHVWKGLFAGPKQTACALVQFRQGGFRTRRPAHRGKAQQGRSNRTAQFTRKLKMEMKKLTIKKSRLVELNRGRLGNGSFGTFINCPATNSNNLTCGVTAKTLPIGIVFDLYSGRFATQAG
jgi:hypothetical protein